MRPRGGRTERLGRSWPELVCRDLTSRCANSPSILFFTDLRTDPGDPTDVFVFAATAVRSGGRGPAVAAQRAEGGSDNGGMEAADTTKDEPQRGLGKTTTR